MNDPSEAARREEERLERAMNKQPGQRRPTFNRQDNVQTVYVYCRTAELSPKKVRLTLSF